MVSSEVLKSKDVGSRIESGNCFGTVRYIGKLPNYSGIWYGIEWDDSSRGKHNGTVNGVQYFETKHPTAGSFVRGEKINFGQSLIEAIIVRYGGQENDVMKKITERQIINLQKSIKAPFIEFVGFDKVSNRQSHFEALSVVSVRLQNVSFIGEPCELARVCPNIREIDVSKNLFSTWEDVFNICEQLPHLYWLNVSENLLEFPEKLTLSKIFPNINELRANNNYITELSTDKKNNFNNLEILDLEDNYIKDWNEVVKLNAIASLQNLSLDGVGLRMIHFKTDSSTLEYFTNLSKLCISNNCIDNWSSISELNKLPCLEELKFVNNPILKSESAETCSAIVIAKIGSLKIYNGRMISYEDRRGSEVDYLKMYGMDWLRVKSSGNQSVFLKEHNRYLKLIQEYGELEAAELQLPETKLKNTLLDLILVCRDRTINKKLSPTMLVQKLKILTQRLFKIPDLPDLVCLSQGNQYEIPLDDDMKEIDFYSLKNGDTILVKPKN
ncbi:hypothetical protein GWI33_013698 [Rhynchophorus ferrugineus]|uniref:Tubulin-specific chaperone E n=1 Tax=Rhynchophorus ferrugineus TaxID=354439 RepID=A0A834I383_RHYFE|nr:hypothetical protein GWI33_013698 [Rhynchophorus ferrugineus]